MAKRFMHATQQYTIHKNKYVVHGGDPRRRNRRRCSSIRRRDDDDIHRNAGAATPGTKLATGNDDDFDDGRQRDGMVDIVHGNDDIPRIVREAAMMVTPVTAVVAEVVAVVRSHTTTTTTMTTMARRKYK